MQYYLSVTGWNLLESFATESLSPFSFYEERNFGCNLSRYLSSNERVDYLILSTKDRVGDYSIRIDDRILNTECLIPLKGKKCDETLFLYPKTIYYQRGYVAFRFNTQELKDSLIAESQILIEIKCINKYKDSFFVKKIITKGISLDKIENPIPFHRKEYISDDNIYDKVKGGIIGYGCGLLYSKNENSQTTIVQLKKLKNLFGGLYTSIMVNGIAVKDMPLYTMSINQCKEVYNQTTAPKTNLFEILTHQFAKICDLATIREKDILSHNHKTEQKKYELDKEKEELVQQLHKIKAEYNIDQFENELDKIKFQERINGEKIGKKRKYFSKNSEEYLRKQYLKGMIKKFEENVPYYKRISQQIADIENKIIELNYNNGKYDEALSALFMRVSDIMNDIIRNVNDNTSGTAEIDLSIFDMDSQNRICIKNDVHISAEIEIFNLMLQYALKHNVKKISDAYILEMITVAANDFKRKYLSTENDDSKLILDTLRSFWNYKNNRSTTFDFPERMPILNSIMAFLIKPLGFDQMERFMLNKGIQNYQFGFMLLGASIGYAAIPKTFTRQLYEEEKKYHTMDEYLFSVYKKIESSHSTISK